MELLQHLSLCFSFKGADDLVARDLELGPVVGVHKKEVYAGSGLCHCTPS